MALFAPPKGAVWKTANAHPQLRHRLKKRIGNAIFRSPPKAFGGI
jgi:hypothetical protein